MDENGIGLELAEGAVRNLRATSATARDILEMEKILTRLGATESARMGED